MVKTSSIKCDRLNNYKIIYCTIFFYSLFFFNKHKHYFPVYKFYGLFYFDIEIFAICTAKPRERDIIY